MNRPNLFIVGAPKCGTTAWHQYLGQHPSISFSGAKEPHFFSSDFPGFRWAKDETEYLKLFSKLPKTKYIGEASVMYLYSEVAAENIFRFSPDAKIIAFVRSPEKFFLSYHSQLMLSLDEQIVDPEAAWMLQDVREAGKKIPGQCREPKFLRYREVSKFGAQLQRFYDRFPASQIKVISFENWTRDSKSTYADVMEFLGLENDGFDDFRAINTKRRNRSRLLGQISRRPPNALLAASRVAKRVLGIRRLGLAAWLRRLNERKKSAHATLSGQMIEQIRAELVEDQALLKSILKKQSQQMVAQKKSSVMPSIDIATQPQRPSCDV